jgi:cation-transporting ATPase 13A1
VTACCFDKTGTLTSDDLVLRGVVPFLSTTTVPSETAEETILPPTEITGPPLWVLAACHSLMTVEGRVVGDPMERAAVEGLGWSVASNGDTVLPPPPSLRAAPLDGERRADLVPLRIHHRFQFSSALRRMSVLASCPVVVRCIYCFFNTYKCIHASTKIQKHKQNRTPPAGRSTSSSSS